MKITIYSINDCKFSQAEKEYLKSKNIQFEEKNLETNREFLTEMLTVSNNFAGTPVTKIEKDDGQTVVLKGYTQSEVDAALGLGSDATTAVTPPVIKEEVAATPEVKPMEPMTSPSLSPSEVPATPDPMSVPGTAALNTPTQADMSGTVGTAMPTDMSTTPSMAMPSTDSIAPVAPMSPTDVSAQPTMDSMSMNNPVSAPAAPAETPTMDTFGSMSQPQGEAIPAAPMSSADTSAQQPAMDPMNMINQMPSTDQSVSATAPTPAAPANDPLSSVLNDLQSKGNS